MCVTAIVASAVATVGGTAASIGAAKSNAAQQRLALEMERKAIQEQRDAVRMQAMEQAIARNEEYEQTLAANRAAAAAMGTRESAALKSVEEQSKKNLAFDLSKLRMRELESDIGAARGIRVNRMTESAVRIGSRYQQIGAIAAGLGGLGDLGIRTRQSRGPNNGN